MKKIIKYSFALMIAMAFFACKKEVSKVEYLGSTAPVLNTSTTDSVKVLLVADQSLEAISFSWTNPDYKFSTGVSSQDVTYTLQIDTAGSNFTNPNKSETSIANDLGVSFTVKELNSKLLGMNLQEDVPYYIEIRLKTSLGASSAVPLYSNVIKLKVTPYLDVAYPPPTDLWITGDATPAGWQTGNSDPEPTPTQKFTKLSKTLFELNVQLTGNNSFLFLPQYGSWNAKYGFSGTKRENNTSGDGFKPGGEDIAAPATSGMYKITVDFKTGKFTVVPL